MLMTKGPEAWGGYRFNLRGERSAQASVPETAHELVLYRQGTEVARQPFDPVPEDLVVLRF